MCLTLTKKQLINLKANDDSKCALNNQKTNSLLFFIIHSFTHSFFHSYNIPGRARRFKCTMTLLLPRSCTNVHDSHSTSYWSRRLRSDRNPASSSCDASNASDSSFRYCFWSFVCSTDRATPWCSETKDQPGWRKEEKEDELRRSRRNRNRLSANKS